RVDVDGDPVPVGHRLRRPHVVEVTVREQHRPGREIGSGEELHERLGGVLAWIDDDALLRVVLREDVAVGLEHPGRESGHEHEHRSYGWKPSRSPTDYALRPAHGLPVPS